MESVSKACSCCIIMNIFPCGCPPEQTIYQGKNNRNSTTPKAPFIPKAKKNQKRGKRGSWKIQKRATDNPTTRLQNAIENCETKCNARYHKAEDLTVHTFSKRVSYYNSV